MTLLDSLNKRLVFLRELCAALELPVTLIHARAEEGGRQPALREQFDVATARAVAALPVLAEYCLPFVKQGGRFIAMKGPEGEAEAAAAAKAVARLGGAPAKGHTVLRPVPPDGEAAEETPQPPRPVRFGRPRFASEEMGLTPAQRGTALHLVMQFIDFSRTETVEQVAGEIRRLVERQMITPQQGEAVRPEKLTAFFSSAIGREVRASETLHREFKFSILVPAAGY